MFVEVFAQNPERISFVSYELVSVRACLYLPGDRVWEDSHPIWSRDIDGILLDGNVEEGYELSAPVYGFDFRALGLKWWCECNQSEIDEEMKQSGYGSTFGDEIFADDRVEMYTKWATEMFARQTIRSLSPDMEWFNKKFREPLDVRYPGSLMDPWSPPEEVSFLVLWLVDHSYSRDWEGGGIEVEVNHGPVGLIDIDKLLKCVVDQP